MKSWSPRSLKNMQGIHPDLRRVLDRALQESAIDFTVIEGVRTVNRQKQMVASGASTTMKSRHITGHAVDLLPINANGKGEFSWPLYGKLAVEIKKAAQEENVPIVWGGDWRTFKDHPHVQLSRKSYP